MGDVWHGGKGSVKRPSMVDSQTVRNNYNRIFRKELYQKQKKQRQQKQKKQQEEQENIEESME